VVAKINGTALGTLTGAVTGAVLTWNGTAWVPGDPPAAAATAHVHVDNNCFNGDGSTTVFYLPVAPLDAMSISVYVAGSRSQDWALSGTFLDVLTFGSAPASGTNNIVVDIVAQV
jgi:hypothetical protein